ncbi:MAG: isoprenylcysteine carboxylmethyltransferase family protein [Anaerolineaceae bacterium]|nr:MAG: isoprenylcysteine carboxylmethyltransferase family protein [Anaerolineaceae bacterium]
MTKKLPPPKYLNILVVLGIMLHFIWPIKRIIHAPFNYLGLGFILLGVILNIWSTKLLKEQKTTINFEDTPDILVVTGPFSISRNPIYLSGVILLLGIAMLLGSVSTFLFPILLLLILDKLYIPSEEKLLEEMFGQRYLDYKQRVRKWI